MAKWGEAMSRDPSDLISAISFYPKGAQPLTSIELVSAFTANIKPIDVKGYSGY